MTRWWMALACFLTLHTAAHADAAQEAWTAAGADTATTAAALSAGLVELNPLGPLGAVALKAAVMGYIQRLPEVEQTPAYHMASSTWAGAAANNLCWIAGAGPVCMLLGALAGRWIWQSGEREREEALASHEARTRSVAQSTPPEPSGADLNAAESRR